MFKHRNIQLLWHPSPVEMLKLYKNDIPQRSGPGKLTKLQKQVNTIDKAGDQSFESLDDFMKRCTYANNVAATVLQFRAYLQLALFYPGMTLSRSSFSMRRSSEFSVLYANIPKLYFCHLKADLICLLSRLFDI